MTLKNSAKELSLRPYNGRLFFAKTKKTYLKAHKELFREPDVLSCSAVEGRFVGGQGPDGMWTYLVWAETPHVLAHELSHAVLEVFDRCGIDPRAANGEPFCYLLSQLILDVNLKAKP
jgi:hypothetical protein